MIEGVIEDGKTNCSVGIAWAGVNGPVTVVDIASKSVLIVGNKKNCVTSRENSTLETSAKSRHTNNTAYPIQQIDNLNEKKKKLN